MLDRLSSKDIMIKRKSEHRNQRILISIILVISLFAFIISQYVYRDTLEDDAYISFRYALNWINGNGLVFNPGEKVEGFTNIFWVVLLIFLKLIGINFELSAAILGFICGAVLLILIFFTKPIDKNIFPFIMPFTALLLSINPAFQAEAAQGLETSLFALLVFAAFSSFLKENSSEKLIGTGFFLGLAAWTRPEGMAIAAYFFLFKFITVVMKNDKKSLHKLLKNILIASFFILTLFLYRYFYYGELLPNTYYAKTGGGWFQFLRGVGYTRGFVHSFGLFTIIFSLIYVFFRIREKEKALFSGGLIFLVFLYVSILGGDYKPTHRFFIVLLPFLIEFVVLAFVYLELDIRKILQRISLKKYLPPKGFLTIILIILYAIISIPRFSYVKEYMIASHQKTILDRMASIWLIKNASKTTVLATEVIGRIPFYTGFKTVDMSGLTDKHIAHLHPPGLGKGIAGHEKTDGSYIILKQPDIILFHSIIFTNKPNVNLYGRNINYFEAELWKVPDFRKKYHISTGELIDKKLYFHFFIRNDSVSLKRYENFIYSMM